MNIAILSRDPKLYSTKRLKQAGEDRGHHVEIIDHMKCVLFIEQKNPMVLYQGKKLDYFDAIIPRIGASVTFYGAAVVRQFEMMKVFTAVESQALIRSRDKLQKPADPFPRWPRVTQNNFYGLLPRHRRSDRICGRCARDH
jgi:ribosomal protein S6--L-glutamate ligase